MDYVAISFSQLKTEESLRESEKRYRELFEAESDAIFLIENETGHVLEANSAASALYGYDRDELLIKKNSDLSAEPRRPNGSQMGRRSCGANRDDSVAFPS